MKSSYLYKKTMLKTVKYQIILIAIMGLGFWVYKGHHAALSVLMGAGVAFLPMSLSGYLLLKTLSTKFKGNTPSFVSHSEKKNTHAAKVLKVFYIGGVVKWVLTLLLFVWAFQWKSVHAFSLLIGFVVGQYTYWREYALFSCDSGINKQNLRK